MEWEGARRMLYRILLISQRIEADKNEHVIVIPVGCFVRWFILLKSQTECGLWSLKWWRRSRKYNSNRLELFPVFARAARRFLCNKVALYVVSS